MNDNHGIYMSVQSEGLFSDVAQKSCDQLPYKQLEIISGPQMMGCAFAGGAATSRTAKQLLL